MSVSNASRYTGGGSSVAPHMVDRSLTSRQQAFPWCCRPGKERAVNFMSKMFWVSLNSLAPSIPQVPTPDFSQKHATATFSFSLLISRK